jgi:hypothetical protein
VSDVTPIGKIPGESQKRRRARIVRLYTRWREVRLADDPWCTACDRIHTIDVSVAMHSGSDRRATEVHHRRLRSDGGAVMSNRNTVTVCHHAHVWVHAHPRLARELGLIVVEGDPGWGDLAAADLSKIVARPELVR